MWSLLLHSGLLRFRFSSEAANCPLPSSGPVDTYCLFPDFARVPCFMVTCESCTASAGHKRFCPQPRASSPSLWFSGPCQAVLTPSTCKGGNSLGRHKASEASIVVKRGMGFLLTEAPQESPAKSPFPASPAVWLLQMLRSCGDECPASMLVNEEGALESREVHPGALK